MSTATQSVEGVSVAIERTHTMTVRVDAPAIPVAVLGDLTRECPAGATVTIRTVEGGSQREPEVVGYVLAVDFMAGAR